MFTVMALYKLITLSPLGVVSLKEGQHQAFSPEMASQMASTLETLYLEIEIVLVEFMPPTSCNIIMALTNWVRGNKVV